LGVTNLLLTSSVNLVKQVKLVFFGYMEMYNINGKSNAICFEWFSSFNVLGPYPFGLELSCKIAIKRKTKLPTMFYFPVIKLEDCIF